MRGKTFLQIFLASFLMLLLVVAATLFSLRPLLTFRDIISVEDFNVPVLFFVLALIFLLSFILAWSISYTLVRSEKKVIDKLHWLYLGKYNQPIFEPTEERTIILQSSLAAIDEEIMRVRGKMISLSREVQELSSRPQQVGAETREEILEKERHRLARELHDSVSQQLFAAMMMLSAINEKSGELPENLQKQIQMVEGIVNESQSEMRALLLHLRPVKLEGKSLQRGIQQLLLELQSKVQIRLKWEISEVSTLPGIEDHLFRIIQELLSNTLRHAKAKTLEVYLHQTDQDISLRVVDDGVGFDSSLKKAGSYGLMNIQERVSGMGGTCKIISFPKKGTSVEIRIPVAQKPEGGESE